MGEGETGAAGERKQGSVKDQSERSSCSVSKMGLPSYYKNGPWHPLLLPPLQ